MVLCKKNIQKWVSIYETCECDIEAPDIHRFPRVDGSQWDTPGFGASHMILSSMSWTQAAKSLEMWGLIS